MTKIVLAPPDAEADKKATNASITMGSVDAAVGLIDVNALGSETGSLAKTALLAGPRREVMN